MAGEKRRIIERPFHLTNDESGANKDSDTQEAGSDTSYTRAGEARGKIGKKRAEYLYLATNPSMPGLVKIGKTKNSPTQRMRELHSTGVPTPFSIELVLAVECCTESERKAHSALHKYRVQKNREFFKITPESAIRYILPVIGRYTVIEARNTHGIDALIKSIAEQKSERERKATIERESRRELEQRQQQEQKREYEIRRREVIVSIEEEEQLVASLGKLPSRTWVHRILKDHVLPITDLIVFGLWWLWFLILIISNFNYLVILAAATAIGVTYLFHRLESHFESHFSELLSPHRKKRNRLETLNAELARLNRILDDKGQAQ